MRKRARKRGASRRLGLPGAVAVGAILALSGCAGDAPPGGDDAAGPASQRARAAGTGRGAAEPAEEIDLQAIAAPIPEYEGQGRNLFAFGPARVAETAPAPPEPAPVAPRPTAPPPPVRTTRTETPPPARVDVKYAGFLEKTQADGNKAKYAIFLDGNEILAAAEGERVANRFTVVEIGLESVTIETASSGGTQRIPLQAN